MLLNRAEIGAARSRTGRGQPRRGRNASVNKIGQAVVNERIIAGRNTSHLHAPKRGGDCTGELQSSKRGAGQGRWEFPSPLAGQTKPQVMLGDRQGRLQGGGGKVAIVYLTDSGGGGGAPPPGFLGKKVFNFVKKKKKNFPI